MSALTDALSLDIPVGVGKQPTRDGAKPFIVIWPDANPRRSVTMKANDGAVETWICHCLGLTPDSAGVAVRKLRAAVLALHRQVIDARMVHMPEELPGPPLQRDDDADPPLFDLTVEWRIRTTPA